MALSNASSPHKRSLIDSSLTEDRSTPTAETSTMSLQSQAMATPETRRPLDLKPDTQLGQLSLPLHERTRAGFEETFELSAHETIHAMNESGRDIASQAPQFRLALKKMGVTRTGIPVRITNPFGGHDLAHLSCDVAMHVSLAEERRGIHVSRLGDTLANHATEAYRSLADYAAQVATATRRVQHAERATVEASGPFAFLEPLEGVKSKVSLESIQLSARAEATADGTLVTTGVSFNHITACPCVQETYRHSHGPGSSGLMDEISRREMPLLTHSQRCRTTVLIEGAEQPPALGKLLDCIDSVVVRCQNTMPREYELLTVHKAHHKPQFLEDVLRELSSALTHLLAGNPGSTRIRITSISMESIHDFDLDGEIDHSLAELQAMLGLA